METVLGNAWYLLNPLIQAGIYFIVFGVLFGARRAMPNYTAFLIIGVFLFHYTGTVLRTGVRIVVSNTSLIESLDFPRALLAIAAVLVETAALLPAVLAMLGVVLVSGEPLELTFVLLIPLVAGQCLLNLGIAFVTSRLTVHFRDMENLIPHVNRVLLYLSGIFYTVEQVPDGLPRTLFLLNPVQAYLNLARSALMGTPVPASAGLVAAAWTVGLVVVGFLFFHRREHEYANV